MTATGTTKKMALAAVANTVNRMNEILLVDLGIQLELVTDASMLLPTQRPITLKAISFKKFKRH